MDVLQHYNINSKLQWVIGLGVAAPVLVTLILYGRKSRKGCRNSTSSPEITKSYFTKLTFIEKENQEAISKSTMSQMIEFLNTHKYKVSEVIRFAITMCQHSHLRYCTLSKVYFDEAIRRAKEIDNRRIEEIEEGSVQPFYGLPIVVSNGISKDSAIVKTIEHLGGIIVGEAISSPNSTKNAWNISKTAGKEGGIGCIVSTGCVHIAFGIDGDNIGSTRVSAHFCGVHSFKATAGRVSTNGIQDYTSKIGSKLYTPVITPIAQSVDDIIQLFRYIFSEEHWQFDPNVCPLPFNTNLFNQSHSTLRIGYYVDDNMFSPNHSCQRAVLDTVDALRDLKFEVVPFETINLQKLIELGKKLEYFSASNSSSIFSRSTMSHYWDLLFQLKREIELFNNSWLDHKIDALVCPVSVTNATNLNISAALPASLTSLFSLINYPAGVVSVSSVNKDDIAHHPRSSRSKLEILALKNDETSENLPVGVQIVAQTFRDEICLYLMKVVESYFSDHQEKSSSYRRYLYKEWQKVGNHGCLDVDFPAL